MQLHLQRTLFRDVSILIVASTIGALIVATATAPRVSRLEAQLTQARQPVQAPQPEMGVLRAEISQQISRQLAGRDGQLAIARNGIDTVKQRTRNLEQWVRDIRSGCAAALNDINTRLAKKD